MRFINSKGTICLVNGQTSPRQLTTFKYKVSKNNRLKLILSSHPISKGIFTLLKEKLKIILCVAILRQGHPDYISPIKRPEIIHIYWSRGLANQLQKNQLTPSIVLRSTTTSLLNLPFTQFLFLKFKKKYNWLTTCQAHLHLNYSKRKKQNYQSQNLMVISFPFTLHSKIKRQYLGT